MEINRFLERFIFYDSVVRDIKISFRTSSAATKIKIIISARDNETLENDCWVNVILEITGVTEFNFRENSKESYQVLSNGLHLKLFENLYYFDFGFHIDAPENSEDFRKSDFYIVGQSLNWKVEIYKESP